MDIAGVSTALSQVNLQSDVGVAMLSKSMDTNEQLGNGLTSMIDAAAMQRTVTPHLGSNFDMSV